MSLICITLNDKTVSELLTSAEKCKSLGAKLLEFRLDYLEPPITQSTLEELVGLKEKSGQQIILTLRPSWEGGKYTGAEEERIAILGKGIELGFDYIDVELNMAKGDRNELISKAKGNDVKTIVSYHDFEQTPAWKEIFKKIEQCSATGADVAKAVFMNNDLLEAFNILKAGKTAFDKNYKFSVLGMGKYGYVSRVLSPVIGGALVYANPDNETPVVTGQVGLSTLKGKYNFTRLDNNTRICGLIGNPLGHSLSPKMHNSAFLALDLNYVYIPLEVAPGQVREVIEWCRSLKFRGLNVTIPYKREAMQYLDKVDALAGEIGAVNTIVNDAGQLIGYNTDGYGALEALRNNGVDITATTHKGKVLILGAGGAAAAVGFALAKARYELIIANRTYINGEKLAAELKRLTTTKTIRLDEIINVIDEVTIMINCTPCGMSEYCTDAPVPGKIINNNMVIFDVVHSPKDTLLLRSARERGAKVIYGYEMLVHQGVKAFELWTGKSAPVEIMRKAVMDELNLGG